MIWESLVISFLACLLIFYSFFKWKFNYWQQRGVPSIAPVIPYGNFKGVGKIRHTNDLIREIYSKFKGKCPLAGAYFSFSAIVVAIDLDLVKNILIKDFNSFHDRWFYYNEKEEPLSANMFALHGEKWKRIRTKLTPTFTSGKMKFMFPTVVSVSSRLVEAFHEEIKLGPEVEVKDILARYTTDVIGECAFGIDCNTLRNANGEFRKFGRVVLGEPRHSRMVINAIKQFPTIAAKLRFKIFRDDVSEFFSRIVRETIDYREKNSIHRNDFMDLLIEMKNQECSGDEKNLTVEEITAQVLLFFIAGFETSSATLSFTLYELALNPEVQKRARDEIANVMGKHYGKLTYDAFKEMQYIDQIISETLRKYPPMAIISRKATHDYKIPELGITLEKETSIFIPAYAIHHDPDIYPDPEVYNPERFNPEEVKKRHPLSYLAFGEGPRNCIGLRFGKLETCIALINLLQNFKFSPCAKTSIPLVFSKSLSLLGTEGGIYLKVERIN